ncbi:MAG: 2TM domain-containing protein [Saprospiraceae bacterium]|nr:2TM domain-containing protein [Saprospiraceae bacterium]
MEDQHSLLYQKLRKKAKKKVETKMAFYICTIVFSFTAVVLLMLSFYLPGAAFWLRLPIPVFIMVLGILYLTAFGLPSTGALSEDWQEAEIEKEMIKLYREKKAQLPPLDELSETEILELKELERLRQKRDRDEDFV